MKRILMGLSIINSLSASVNFDIECLTDKIVGSIYQGNKVDEDMIIEALNCIERRRLSFEKRIIHWGYLLR